jgi:hypothetical protein
MRYQVRIFTSDRAGLLVDQVVDGSDALDALLGACSDALEQPATGDDASVVAVVEPVAAT